MVPPNTDVRFIPISDTVVIVKVPNWIIAVGGLIILLGVTAILIYQQRRIRR